MTLDPQEYARGRIRATRRAALAPDDLRAALRTLLGRIDSWERVEPNPQVTGSTDLPGVRAQKLRFATRPGLDAAAWFLQPTHEPRQRTAPPGILALPGHEASLASFCGIGADGSFDAAKQEQYHHVFPLALAQQGFPVLALEQVGFGERRPAGHVAQGEEATSCHEDVGAALMLGETVLGWRVWDAMRALDLLTGLTGVENVATVGISGGGTTSLFTAALDERVGFCGVSGYLTGWLDSILAVQHCIDNYVPGIAAVADAPDVAALVAPRWLWVENGRADEIFPIQSHRRAVAQVQAVYDAAGGADRFRHHEFDGDHHWDGAGLVEALTDWSER